MLFFVGLNNSEQSVGNLNMKKLLGILVLGLLLSGCATGTSKTGQKYLQDNEIIKVGMNYKEFKKLMIPYGTDVNYVYWSALMDDKNGNNNYLVVCVTSRYHAGNACAGDMAKSEKIPGYVFKGELGVCALIFNFYSYVPPVKCFKKFELVIIENSKRVI